MPETASVPAVAFFDVDETLAVGRTLESFLLHYRRRHPEFITERKLRGLYEQVVTLNRVDFNREYFKIWAGRDANEVFDAGEAWYRGVDTNSFYRPEVLERLEAHRAAGAHIVLVSGSFRPVLAPIASALNAARLYCTELVIDANGRFTGEIASTMLDADKPRAIRDYLHQVTSPLATMSSSEDEAVGHDGTIETYAYGDHISDLPMLLEVSNPTVVGPDPQLGEAAKSRNWTILEVSSPLAPRSHG